MSLEIDKTLLYLSIRPLPTSPIRLSDMGPIEHWLPLYWYEVGLIDVPAKQRDSSVQAPKLIAKTELMPKGREVIGVDSGRK